VVENLPRNGYRIFTGDEGAFVSLGVVCEQWKERQVPHIIVMADRDDDRGEGAVMLRERVNVTDFESRHFASQLVERLGWAVGDADAAEHERVTR
jgi:hypothetical protein